MKGVLFYEHGGPEVLRYEEMEEPEAGEHEVVVRIKAVGMNYNDIWARQGLPGIKFTLPHIPGTDAAGEIVQIGKRVTTVKVGDRVAVHPILSCRICSDCTSGREYFCRNTRVWGFQTGPRMGGYVQYANLPEANVFPIPDTVTYEEAASLTACLGTSWHMLVTRARIQPGETVLIWGATSGIGTTAIQIAKLFNARVIAVAGSDEKLEAARQLGADETINYRTENVFRTVRKLTDKRGVDVVFEHTGVNTWNTSIQCMAYGARLVTCGNTTGFHAQLDLRVLFWKQLSLLGCHSMNKYEVQEGWKFVKTGHIKPLIDRILPLEHAAEAHSRFESDNRVGRIILTPWEAKSAYNYV
ncbi:zinc-binding dehydrogenase [Paenibacillus glufosinatiresistens]|uniref:zinc-binding dehydrogenase n=1 Tax=Paenibacillus glufosinatiresistens TaxID=3070657 RepID=UPI00286DC100|nr:zinc-binding dehydrogenase [Paenibacillus sp. YX.27]